MFSGATVRIRGFRASGARRGATFPAGAPMIRLAIVRAFTQGVQALLNRRCWHNRRSLAAIR